MRNTDVPHSEELELCLLSALMFNPETAMTKAIAHLPTGNEFFKPRNTIIYQACLLLYDSGKPTSISMIAETIRNKGLFDQVGKDYFETILEAYPSDSSIELHAKQIREHHIRRLMIQRMTQLIADCKAFRDIGDITGDLIDLSTQSITTGGEVKRLGHGKKELKEEIDKRWEARKENKPPSGITSGIREIDDRIGGIHRNELLVVSSRPGVGKTHTLCHMSLEAEYGGSKVGVWSLEMSEKQLCERMVCNVQDLNGLTLRRGNFNHERVEANYRKGLSEGLDKLSDKNIWVYDKDSTIDEVIGSMHLAHRLHNIDVFFLDHLQEIKPSLGDKSLKKHEQVGNNIKKLRNLAKRLGVGMVVLAQINRAGENNAGKRPTMSNLKDSGEIEEAADEVIILHRKEEDNGLIEFWLDKNRHGEKGVFEMVFLPAYAKLEEKR